MSSLGRANMAAGASGSRANFINAFTAQAAGVKMSQFGAASTIAAESEVAGPTHRNETPNPAGIQSEEQVASPLKSADMETDATLESRAAIPTKIIQTGSDPEGGGHQKVNAVRGAGTGRKIDAPQRADAGNGDVLRSPSEAVVAQPISTVVPPPPAPIIATQPSVPVNVVSEIKSPTSKMMQRAVTRETDFSAGSAAVTAPVVGQGKDAAANESFAGLGTQPVTEGKVVSDTQVARLGSVFVATDASSGSATALGHGTVAASTVQKRLDQTPERVATHAGAPQELETIVATPHLLEVGVDGGTHGWLRVRAEMGSSGLVTASMVAGSAGAAETLRREMPGMAEYLKSEAVGVSSVAVDVSQPATATPGADAVSAAHGDTWSGMGQGATRDSAQRDNTRDPAGALCDVKAVRLSGVDVELSLGALVMPVAMLGDGSGSGGWLSVRV